MVWGVPLSREGHNTAEAEPVSNVEGNMCGPAMRGTDALPWSKNTSRTKGTRRNVRPPRFRRVPFVRDVFFDHGRASVPRIAGPHMLPSTLLTGSASAVLWLSRLNGTPHTIAVYASHPPSPATTQHSLPGARYGLPGPVSHRQDHPPLPRAQAIPPPPAVTT